MKKLQEIRINDSFTIKRSGEGFTLIQLVNGKDKDGNPKKQESFTYYGCLYQALQGFMKKTVNMAESLDSIRQYVNLAMCDIEDAEGKIKENFSIVIHKEK